MVLYNASPKASATSASSAQSRRSILKYLSVETEIHVSAEEQAANLVHQASAHPGHRTLEQRHARRAPAGAHFPFDCGDGRHTGRVQQRERQKAERCQRRENGAQCLAQGGDRGARQHGHGADDCLLGGKARNESRRGAPVGKAQRREHGRNDPADARQHTGGAVRHHVEADVEGL